MQDSESDIFRDQLSTVDDDGHRKWIYPKRPSGKYYRARTIVGIILLAFLVSAPFIKIGGNPLMMFNVIERKFSIFGMMFYPHDFHLFMFATIAGVVFIAVFTLILGRLFCGWVCPQTIFMEIVFRRIEYWIEGDWDAQKALNKAPGSPKKAFKKILKHTIFLAISFFISNIFLAYLIGSEALLKIVTDPPSQHVAGLIIIIAFSLAFYAVFAFVREQVCTNICPYGRLQGALMDKDTMLVAYDHVRGEPRGKFRKNEERGTANKGDCVDCKQCIHVCPTGIDIRNGTQLECTNCTACIDACDAIMEKLAMPGGLIRYASERSIQEKTPFRFIKRNIFFLGILGLLVGVFVVLLLLRGSLEATILRTSGLTYTEDGDKVKNLYNYTIVNKTGDTIPLHIQLEEGSKGTIQMIGREELTVAPQGKIEGSFFVLFPKGTIKGNKNDIEILVTSKGEVLDETEMNFIAPNAN